MTPAADTTPHGGGRGAVAVILCAGSGTRMRSDRNKILLPLAGKPLLVHTLAAFAQSAAVDGMLLVARADEITQLRALAAGHGQGETRLLGVIAGGATRHQSEHCALQA